MNQLMKYKYILPFIITVSVAQASDHAQKERSKTIQNEKISVGGLIEQFKRRIHTFFGNNSTQKPHEKADAERIIEEEKKRKIRERQAEEIMIIEDLQKVVHLKHPKEKAKVIAFLKSKNIEIIARGRSFLVIVPKNILIKTKDYKKILGKLRSFGVVNIENDVAMLPLQNEDAPIDDQESGRKSREQLDEEIRNLGEVIRRLGGEIDKQESIPKRAEIIRERAGIIRERAGMIRERAGMIRERAEMIRKRAGGVRKQNEAIPKRGRRDSQAE